ncbi:MAG: amino acid ABC transporter ATP-binding protein [Bifidobacterium sp.]|jgi:polar amino acid transport system ATP-binding protein|nr:amino acid ABC transporter ATP-binding protein [Bifidobacterium sp.]
MSDIDETTATAASTVSATSAETSVAAAGSDSAATPAAADSSLPVLRLDQVRKSFGSATVLNGISFEVREHEVVALLGPSGSGKSTLMRCINLLERVDDGQIWLRDCDITDPRVNQDRIRARIGVVFQQFNLFPHMSVLKNVTLAALKVLHWNKDRANERAFELLDRIGMRSKADAYPDQLSGGQQQRVAIARALMSDPELLLLDEITSALDPMLVGEVLDMVSELKQNGTTILMATHEMSFAHRAADRVVLLRHGVIAQNGTPAQVMDESQDPATKEFFSHFRGL